jgi:hypothetical protein
MDSYLKAYLDLALARARGLEHRMSVSYTMLTYLYERMVEHLTYEQVEQLDSDLCRFLKP